MSAGSSHTCALTTKGKAICWGYNSSGQLGNNTRTDSSTPVGVHGLSKGAKSITSGAYHTCAVTTKGKVLCWGYNGYGELGNGTTTSSTRPTAVVRLGKVKTVSGGLRFTCALTTTSKVFCWGFNGTGQLGIGTTASSSAPVAVRGLGKAKAITAGGDHACALTTKGKAMCWGFNDYGQLGDNTATTSLLPVPVYGSAAKAKMVSASYNTTCAVTTKGAAKCWGYNGYGQLGNNTTAYSSKPVSVSGLSRNVTSVKASYSHTCAVTTKGAVRCWGANDGGQLGDNTVKQRLTPVGVYNLDRTTGVSLGSAHTCVRTAKRAVKCWGYNDAGQLGNGTARNSVKPVRVRGF